MLQRMNKISKSWISSLFLGVLAISFGVFFNIRDVITGVSSDNTVATVGSAKISGDAYKRNYDQYMKQMTQQNPGLTPEIARAMGSPQRVLQEMIDQATIDSLGSNLGMAVTDDQVDAMIRQTSTFRDASGNFDYNQFLRALDSAGYTERDYKDLLRQVIMGQQIELAMKSNFTLPLGFSHALYDFLGETRAAEYVVVTPASLTAIADPGDAVLAAYLKKNVDRFSTPEYRSVTYAAVTPDDLKGQITVPEAEVAQAYDQRKASYTTPEKRDIEQISYPDEAGAKAARAKIAKGQTFAAAAAERGVKPADLSLGTLVAADLPGERGKAAFALKQGEVSQPVKDTFGWMLMHVTKIVPGATKDEATAKGEIRSELASSMAAAKIDEMVNAFQDARAGGADIPTAAKKAGMQTAKLAAIDSTGKMPDGLLSTAPTDPEFLAQAFKADVGDEGDPFRTAAGGAYVIKVESATPPKPRPLADVRKDVLAAWTADERAARLKAKADELAAQAKKENSLTGIASSIKASVQKTPGLKRTSTNETFSSALLQQLFTAPRDGVITGPLDKGDGYVIARLTGIAHPATADNSTELTGAREQLSQQMATDFMGTLSKAEQAKLKITRNDKLVDQLVGGEQ